MKPQDYEQLTLFPEASLDPASHLALPGSDEARRMTVTSGLKCLELYRNSVQAGSSGRTYLDLFERRLMKFLKVSKSRTTQQGHMLSRLKSAEPYSKEKESLLWPRPTTGAPLCGGTRNFRQMLKLRDAGIITEEERKNLTQGHGGKSNPALMEWLMGFPIGWTDLNASETQ